jgi:DNA ligase (NAD+)
LLGYCTHFILKYSIDAFGQLSLSPNLLGMYNQTQQQQLQQLTLQLQQQILQQQVFDVALLKQVLHFHEHQYYVQNNPLISDYEYDKLYKALEKYEAENPLFITPDSPTQRVGNSLNKAFVTVQHLVPMLSLENSYNEDDLQDWNRKAMEAAKLQTIEYCVEPKFDGASISLIYENDMLVRAATRGDGVEGDDITTNIKQIKSIPLKAPFSKYGIEQIEIRGEVIMRKDAFEKYNSNLAIQGLPLLANPRNAASGSLRLKDPKEVGKRMLDAFLYHISFYTTNKKIPLTPLVQTHGGCLQLLWECGLKAPQLEKKVTSGIVDVINYVQEFESKRDDLRYEIDGMVIKVNTIDLQEKLGQTTHHPRWAIAFKFKARQATTKIFSIEYQVGRTGAVTPVAKLQPVQIGGVTVSSISVHNEEYIREKDLQIGDIVLIERAGDVIPQIVKSIPELRDGTQQAIAFPTECPVCNSKLFKEEGEAVWRCINIECAAQIVEKIIHFVSKDALDIKSFGDANVRKFYELNLLKDIPSIYKLDYETISALEGFGKKSIDNLQLAIEASKQQPLHRIIYGLGIRFVGETTAKTLANSITHLLDLQQKTQSDLEALEDIGVKVANSIVLFFSNQQNIAIIKELEILGLNLTNTKKETISNGYLTGKTFLFTGTLNKLKRSQAENMAEKKGATIASGVSAKLNYLVVGEDAGSKLEKAKKINTITVLTEDEFVEMMERKG